MRKGNINRGFVKRTLKQKKKHYTQFNADELKYLVTQLHNIENITPSWHLVEKNDLKIKKRDILDALNDDELKDMIIEYNSTNNYGKIDKRVLIRSKKSYFVDINNTLIECNLCFVISIVSGQIITAYYNEKDDNHNTIDWFRYDKNLKII